MAKITPRMMRSIPRGRDIVSFSFAFDEKGRMMLVKFRLRGGREEVMHLPPVVAFHVRDSCRRAIGGLSVSDERRRKSDPRPEIEAVSEFLENQPDFGPDDWNSKPDGEPRVSIGCEFHAAPDAVFMAFQLRDDLYKIYSLAPALMFHLAEGVERGEAAGILVDISRTPAASKSTH